MHPDYLAPHYANSALLCIDMQNDFVLPQADYAIPGTHEVAPAVALLANHFRTAGRPIYHAVRLYLPADAPSSRADDKSSHRVAPEPS